MTNKLKTTLKGTAFAFALFSFIGCDGGDDNTNTTSNATVALTGASVTPAVVSGTPTAVSANATGNGRVTTVTKSDGTTASYYIPAGIELTTDSTALCTIPSGSSFATGTISDPTAVTVQTGTGTAKVDASLIDASLNASANIALPPGNYTVTLPSVNINNALPVTNLILKNINVSNSGTSNLIQSFTSGSKLPAPGASVANTKLGLVLGTAAAGTTVSATIVSGGKTTTVSTVVDSSGNANFDFTGKTSTLGSTVDSLTLDLNTATS